MVCTRISPTRCSTTEAGTRARTITSSRIADSGTAMTIAGTARRRAPRRCARREFDDGFVAPFRTRAARSHLSVASRFAVRRERPSAALRRVVRARTRRPRRSATLGMLARLYDPSVPRGDTGRAHPPPTSSAICPGDGTRLAPISPGARCSSRAPSLPPLVRASAASRICLPAQGFGILRRDDGRCYVALDYGHSGGGHGHPDRLNLLLSDGDARWFDDPGTGSYVDRVAALVSQHAGAQRAAARSAARSRACTATLLRVRRRTATQAGSARRRRSPTSSTCSRTIVVLRGLSRRQVEWEELSRITRSRCRSTASPCCVRRRCARRRSLARSRAAPEREDGFSISRARPLACQSPTTSCACAGESRGATAMQRLDADRWRTRTRVVERGRALGAPGRARAAARSCLRGAGSTGTIVGVWSWRGDVVVRERRRRRRIRVTRAERRRATRTLQRGAGWRDRHGRWPLGSSCAARRASRPATLRTRHSDSEHDATPRDAAASRSPSSSARTNYRRSEESWAEAGRPTRDRLPRASTRDGARRHGRRAAVGAAVRPDRHREPVRQRAGLDQWRQRAALRRCGGERTGGWLLVPERRHPIDVGMRAVDGWTNDLAATPRGGSTGDGYQPRGARSRFRPNAAEFCARRHRQRERVRTEHAGAASWCCRARTENSSIFVGTATTATHSLRGDGTPALFSVRRAPRLGHDDLVSPDRRRPLRAAGPRQHRRHRARDEEHGRLDPAARATLCLRSRAAGGDRARHVGHDRPHRALRRLRRRGGGLRAPRRLHGAPARGEVADLRSEASGGGRARLRRATVASASSSVARIADCPNEILDRVHAAVTIPTTDARVAEPRAGGAHRAVRAAPRVGRRHARAARSAQGSAACRRPICSSATSPRCSRRSTRSSSSRRAIPSTSCARSAR